MSPKKRQPRRREDTKQIEASTVGLVSMVLVTMAAVASWLPALTATKVDPVVALRDE